MHRRRYSAFSSPSQTGLSRLPALPSNLPPLRQHVREQDVRARHIDGQDSPKRVPKQFIPLACERDGLVHQPTFGRDA